MSINAIWTIKLSNTLWTHNFWKGPKGIDDPANYSDTKVINTSRPTALHVEPFWWQLGGTF